MSLKTIFQEGMKERQRRKSLGKRGNEFKEKEKALAERLTALGEKAWEAKTDISAFADLRSILGEMQRSIDDLRGESEQLLRQQQESEEKRKRESSRLASALKEAEEGLQGIQKSLSEQKGTLQSAQREAQRSRERLAAIARERDQLQGKAAGADASEAEKGEIAKGLALLEKEETSLKSGQDASEAAARPAAALVASLQEQVEVAKKKLEALRQEQKQMLGELDKALASLKASLAKNGEKAREAETKRRESFRALGEKLAQAGTSDPGLAAEMAAATAARSEMEGVQAMIGGLERQKDEGQVNAYKKMLTILISGIVLLAVIIIALILLLAPGKKATPLEGLLSGKGEAAQNLGELAGQMQKGFSGIKEASEKIQGEKIVIASPGSMTAALPAVNGWQRRDPRYSRGSFQDLETANMQADYTAGDDTVSVHITDAGTASAMLAPLKMVLAMNIRVDDGDALQQASTVNGIPVVERLDRQDGEATMGIIYKDRYLIELKTRSARALELLREFAARLDLAKLP